MSAPRKTSRSEIVRVASRLLERHARNEFSLNDVAIGVGIRAPSLYRHFTSRATLLAEVERILWLRLGKSLLKASRSSDPEKMLLAQASAYRSFAHANPNGYALMFDADAPHSAEGAKARADALAPAWPAFAAISGTANALKAARVLTPFIHGFVSMELADAFRLGGGLDEAFDMGVKTIIKGLKAKPHSGKRAKSRSRG